MTSIIIIGLFLIASIIFIGGSTLILSYHYSRPSKPKFYFGIDFAILDQISPVIILWHDPNAHAPYRIQIHADVLNLDYHATSIEGLAETIEEFVEDAQRWIDRE